MVDVSKVWGLVAAIILFAGLIGLFLTKGETYLRLVALGGSGCATQCVLHFIFGYPGERLNLVEE